MKIKKLRTKADYIRDKVIEVSIRNKAGHIASSLSCLDILVALYYKCMRYNPQEPFWEDRDRLVFSKAHGCYAVYAILADMGVIPAEEWENFYTQDSSLSGCMERRIEYGLEAACGSLGHGLPMAVGLAYGARLQDKKYHTFCVLGDGELQEGSVWECLQFAVKHGLNNLTIIIDYNRLQAMDFIVNILNKKEGDAIRRLKGFGLSPVSCFGHDVDKLVSCINKCKASRGMNPGVIIAKSIKGFGLRCMENIPRFHFRIPTDAELTVGRSYERKL